MPENAAIAEEKISSSPTAVEKTRSERPAPTKVSSSPPDRPAGPQNTLLQQSSSFEETIRGVDGQRPAATEQTQSPEWPEAWQVLLARTKPAPIVWTYAELGEDLSGNGDKERSACLRRLIASLQLPKGSSAFWPVCLAPFIEEDLPTSREPGNASLSADEAEFFQAGLPRLAPRVVIMLGTQAMTLSGLDLPMTVSFTQQIHKGILYLLLPDFASLLSKAALQERAGVFLRAALSGLSLS